MRRLSSAAMAAVLSLAATHAARAQGTVLPESVVTATRVPTQIERVPAGVTVIDRATIQSRGYNSLVDALSAVPGLRVVQSGGDGANASVFTRGTNSNATLVLRDGVPINDPSDPGGAFNFGVDPLGDIERIEVVRGPMSGVYGSGAIGGVINIITRRPTGTPQASLDLAAGYPAAGRAIGSLTGTTGRFDYSLQAEGQGQRGFDNTPRRMSVFASEWDGYTGGLAAAEVGFTPVEGTRVFGYVRGRTARFGLDDTGFPAFDSAKYDGTDQNIMGRVGVSSLLFGGVLDTRLNLSQMRSFRHYTQQLEALDPSQTSSNSRYRGERTLLQWNNTVHLPDWGAATASSLIFGLEHTVESSRSSLDTSSGGFGFQNTVDASATNNAANVGLQTLLFQRLTVTLDLRQQNARYGGDATTWRTGGVLAVPEVWSRFKLAYGTAFKAPSLFDLFGQDNFGYVGNPGLKPERSQGWEAGIAIDVPALGRSDFATLEVTYFDNRVRDLINVVFNSSFTASTTENVASARSQGVESSLTLRPASWLEAILTYTYTDSRNVRTNAQLLRRPLNQASANLRITPLPKLTITPEVLYTGAFQDFLSDNNGIPVGVAQAKAGTIVNLGVNYAITPQTTAYVDARNLFNSRFEAANGFQIPGARVLAGVRMRF
jgi:vitamin B12 transporter